MIAVGGREMLFTNTPEVPKRVAAARIARGPLKRMDGDILE